MLRLRKVFSPKKTFKKEQLKLNKIYWTFPAKFRILSNIYDKVFRKIVSRKKPLTFM